MNRLVRFLCLIFGISVDGGAAQREQWAQRRRELGIEPTDDQHDHAEERPAPVAQPREPAHSQRP